MGWETQLQVIGEVALAMVLGGLIGLEREMADRPAGFRTQMLVAGAAALLVGLSDALVMRFSGSEQSSRIVSDPVRIVEAIITGVSFLGAGTIFRRGGDHVAGLTTAASILLSSAIGVGVALRQFVLVIGVTGLTLFVLRALLWVEAWLNKRKA
jgi:putative Mg2+ transporter-C (MgtC) family protein